MGYLLRGPEVEWEWQPFGELVNEWLMAMDSWS